MAATKAMEPPANWLRMIENIRRIRLIYPAPVDTMGCAKHEEQRDVSQRFHVLVSLMLSSQTKDPITWAAVQRLKEHNLCNVKSMVNAQEKDIEDLIYPVGFYRRKAIYLKKVAKILEQEYDCDIPRSIKDLCKLPGVGPKMAYLCMSEAWNELEGIGVDTHVHRIAARLGWVPSKGIKTPEDTRKALESWLPREYWREINLLLVGFGQTICNPTRPKCSECFNSLICPSSSITNTTTSTITTTSGTDKNTKGKKKKMAAPVKIEGGVGGGKMNTKMEAEEKQEEVKVKKEREEVRKEEEAPVAIKAEDNEDTKPKVRASKRVKR